MGHLKMFNFVQFFCWEKLHIKFTILRYTVQWFLVYSQYCTIMTTMKFQNISITPKSNPYLGAATPKLSILQPPATISLPSVSKHWPILNISSKQKSCNMIYFFIRCFISLWKNNLKLVSKSVFLVHGLIIIISEKDWQEIQRP